MLNSVSIAISTLPTVPSGCVCGNCATTTLIQSFPFPRGINDYAKAGRGALTLNSLRLSPSSDICISNIIVSVQYLPAIPTISAISPRGGPTKGGTQMTFLLPTPKKGSPPSLAPSVPNLQAYFDGALLNVSADGDPASVRGLKVTVPAATSNASVVSVYLQERLDASEGERERGAAGAMETEVETDLSVRAAQTFHYYYYEPPTITRLFPVRGSSEGGVPVTLYGRGFTAELADDAACRFGPSSKPTPARVASSLEYAVCDTPPHANGTVSVMFAMNGVDFEPLPSLTYEFEDVVQVIWLVLAAAFVIVSAAVAVSLRVKLAKRAAEVRGGGGRTGRGERDPLLSSSQVQEDGFGGGSGEVDPADIEILERIGKGTYGEVFRGKWHGTVVAIKKLPAHSVTPQFIRDFRKEANMMRHLRHPNVLQFLGASLTSDQHDVAIVLEYMERNSLWANLHNARLTLSWKWPLLAALADAARGMSYLHGANLLHRDLKSHNLLVNAEWRVKVCDFGLSRNVVEGDNSYTACGTPSWSAPEVLTNSSYGKPADVYSFAIVVWECATRDDPYKGMSPFAIVFAVGNGGLRPKVPLPRTSTEKVLFQLMTRAWAANPRKRPPFREILATLETLLADEAASQADVPVPVPREERRMTPPPTPPKPSRSG